MRGGKNDSDIVTSIVSDIEKMPRVQSLVAVAGVELNRALQEVKKRISGPGLQDYRIILVGRVAFCGLFRPSPAQSQASFEVRPGCSGFDPAGA